MSSAAESQRSRRYDRHLALPEVGVEGQARLGRARVLVAGAGGLGCPAALYLAAAGVGVLGIADFDVVEESNLQRQVLHGDADLGRAKVDSARARLRALNPLVAVETFPFRLDAGNVMAAIAGFDVIIDGSDNFPTRYLLNDACVLSGKPYVYGAVHRFEGQVSVFGAPGGPCYRCFFADPPPPELTTSCGVDGVLGVVPGVIGCLQANEALKLILAPDNGGDGGGTLAGRLLLFNAWTARFREISLRRNKDCPVCGDHPRLPAPVAYRRGCDLAASGTPAITELTPEELERRWASATPPQIVDIREAREWATGTIPGALRIPWGEWSARRHEIDPERALVLVCQRGVRSARAAARLLETGSPRDVAHLAGGMDGWTGARTHG